MTERPLTVMQLLPALEAGGVERGTVELARHLAACGHHAIVIAAGGRMSADLAAAGVEHLDWEIGRKRITALRWVGRLRALFEERRPDVVHLRSRLPAWLGWLAWRQLEPDERPRLVTTVHGFYTPGRYSAVMTRGERVIAVSESVRRYIRERYPRVDPERIRVIHRGVDPRRYPYGYRPPADWHERWGGLGGGDRFVITLPARLTRWKGQLHFLEVVAGLKARGVPVRGLIVGAAHPRRRTYAAEVGARITALGLDDDVVMLGHRDDLREVLAISDAVLSLSTDPEAFGRTTLEALAMGRPVLGYGHGGVAEQLAALLPEGTIEPGDWSAAIDRLERWYREPPTVAQPNPFTLERMLESTVETYRELLATAR